MSAATSPEPIGAHADGRARPPARQALAANKSPSARRSSSRRSPRDLLASTITKPHIPYKSYPPPPTTKGYGRVKSTRRLAEFGEPSDPRASAMALLVSGILRAVLPKTLAIKGFVVLCVLGAGILFGFHVTVHKSSCARNDASCQDILWKRAQMLFQKLKVGSTAAPAAGDIVTTTETDYRDDEEEGVHEWLQQNINESIKIGNDNDYYREAKAAPSSCPQSLRKRVMATAELRGLFQFDLPVLLWKSHLNFNEWQRLTKYRLPYGWRGMNWTDMVDAMESLGAPENRELFDDRMGKGGGRCVRCAVVGNGGILSGAGMGKEIDAHDYVFRMNGAITDGFESDVGTRTSFYLFSTNTMKNSRLAYQEFGFEHPSWSPETRYIFIPCGYQDYYMVTAAARGSLVHKGEDKNDRPWKYFGKENVAKKIKMLHPDFLRYLKNNFLPSGILQTDFRNFYRPSTGAIALLTALHTCDEVSAYGFITSNFRKFPDHYFDKKQKLVFYVNHDLSLEKKLWKKLNDLDIMKLYRRKMV
ncbi:alpha-N-acetylgalactosaminide alpha-2,6-sialyltransferase 2-like [Lampetra planeri]